jgi:hypothetical protein
VECLGIALTQTLLLQLREKETTSTFRWKRFGELKIVQKYTSLKIERKLNNNGTKQAQVKVNGQSFRDPLQVPKFKNIRFLYPEKLTKTLMQKLTQLTPPLYYLEFV